ncbi:MAG TPA: ribonuclease, partial [Campylobacterales bacterium]|nr:ribonuclease [Campylobacterales bacterium]
MSPFAIQLQNGFLESDLELEDKNSFQSLKQMSVIEEIDGLWKLKSLYRVGRLYINKQGKGFVEASTAEQKDLLIEPDDIGDANHGDVVVVKRIIARRGRASAKVVLVVKQAHIFNILYTNRNEVDTFEILNIKMGLPSHAVMEGMDLKAFKIGTVLKVDSLTDRVLEVFGDLSDPKVDEKISLALYNRADKFEQDCIDQAKKVEKFVNADKHPNRIDLRELDFCTIDPV